MINDFITTADPISLINPVMINAEGERDIKYTRSDLIGTPEFVEALPA